MESFDEKARIIFDKVLKIRKHRKFLQLTCDEYDLAITLKTNPTRINCDTIILTLYNNGKETIENYHVTREQPCDLLAELDKMIGEK